MATPGTPLAISCEVLAHGSCRTRFELDGAILALQWRKAPNPEALQQVTAPPEHDEEKTGDVEALRQRIRRATGFNHGSIPLAVVQTLPYLFGYKGPAPVHVTSALRLLLELPTWKEIDWSQIVTVTPDADAPADDVPPVTTPTDRVTKLEGDILTLTASFQSLQMSLQKHVLEAVRAALTPSGAPQGYTQPPPPPQKQTQATAAPSQRGPGAAPTQSYAVHAQPHAQAASAMETEELAPWEYKSGAQPLAVLGTIYHHLIATGATSLANELYAVKSQIDYAFLPATEAIPNKSTNIYHAKHSGKDWDADYPPPGSCHHCGSRNHWSMDCPTKKQKEAERAAQTFSRGHPPARYYISKAGKVQDTQRRPTTDCFKCNKPHFWFSCPKSGDTITVPKGARFTDHLEPNQRPQNSRSARVRRPSGATTSDETEVSLSDPEPILPQKRTRLRQPKVSNSAPPSPPPPVSQPNPGFPPAMWTGYPHNPYFYPMPEQYPRPPPFHYSHQSTPQQVPPPSHTPYPFSNFATSSQPPPPPQPTQQPQQQPPVPSPMQYWNPNEIVAPSAVSH